MATDVILTLDELRCAAEDDGSGGSEPYVWPAMIWIDDGTLATPQLVGSRFGRVEDARRAVASGMRAGQTARIPNGILSFRRDDSKAFRGLVLVVALWEEDETPTHVVRAAFAAFRSELPAAIAANLLAIENAGEDEEERERIKAEIAERVSGAIRSAIEDELTIGEKIRIKIGTLNLDDFVTNAFESYRSLQARDLTLPLIRSSSEEYSITGRLEVRPVTIDPCQSQVAAVAAARSVVNGVNAEIEALQAELNGETPNGETPRPKSEINKEIRRVREEELRPAQRALDAAEASLRQCRLGQPVDAPVDGGVLVAER